MSAKEDLINLQKEYIKLLEKALNDVAPYLYVHSIEADAEDVEKGEELRLKIFDLENAIANEFP